MIASMTVKLAISLPDHLAHQVRNAVRMGRASSVSAYIAAALEEFPEPQTIEEFFDEWEAESGPVPPEVEQGLREQFHRLGLEFPGDDAP
jgi:Arc/MetJ-type ribon-helix-helix transcriptional regulator